LRKIVVSEGKIGLLPCEWSEVVEQDVRKERGGKPLACKKDPGAVQKRLALKRIEKKRQQQKRK